MTWKRFAAIAAAMIVLQRLAGRTGAAETIQPLLIVGLNLFTIVAIRIGVRQHKPADKLTWRLLVASLTMYLVGNAVLYVCTALGVDAYPGPADAVFFAQYGVLIMFMLRIVRARTGHHGDLGALLDALVIASGASLLCWQFWVSGAVAGAMPLPTRLTIVSYPILDVVVFALAARALLAQGTKPVSLRLVSACLFTLFLADSVAGWQVSRGTYTLHNWVDVLWNTCFLLAGTLALHPSMASLTAPVDAMPSTARSRTLRMMAMVGASAMAPTMLAFHGLAEGHLKDLVIAGFALAMFGGVITRAHIASKDDALANEALRRKQAELHHALAVLRTTEQERAQLLESVIRAGEQERMWVAAELHDGPIQQLSALGFGIDRVRRRLASGDTQAGATALEASRDELTRIVGGLRKLMSELRPPALDESGLEGALRDYVASFRHDSGIHCALEVSIDGLRLAPEVETTLYRVAQEALTNVRRHSHARNSCVDLFHNRDAVMLRVRDDGRGFDATKPISDDHVEHYGLIGMRERVEQRGGIWRVQSEPGRGTTIDAEFPIRVPEHAPALEVAQ